MERTALSGKTALVTGAARRIGRAAARALAREGVKIVIHYHTSKDEAIATAEEVRANGVEAWLCSADLSDPDQVVSMIENAIDLTKGIDYLINSASIFTESRLTDMTEEDLLQNIRVNAFAPLQISRRFAAQRREGAIVNFLDTRIADYDREHFGYHLSKRMFHTMSRSLSLEFAPLIRVNAIAPGLILPPPGQPPSYLEKLKNTNPLQRIGTLEQITDSVIFLLKNEFVTGQVIFIDGGRHLKGSVYGIL